MEVFICVKSPACVYLMLSGTFIPVPYDSSCAQDSADVISSPRTPGFVRIGGSLRARWVAGAAMQFCRASHSHVRINLLDKMGRMVAGFNHAGRDGE